jgi:hypothetical protein
MSFCCKPLRKMVRHGSTLDSFHPDQPVGYHGSLAVTSYPSFSSWVTAWPRSRAAGRCFGMGDRVPHFVAILFGMCLENFDKL